MEPGSYLTDASTGDTRFRLERHLVTGREHEIVLLEDDEREGAWCCGRTMLYDPGRSDDAEYVELRRDLLRRQRRLLESTDIGGLPEARGWVELEQDDGAEPVLVCDFIEGRSLYDYVSRESPHGLDPAPATTTMRKVAQVVSQLHDAGWLFRDLDPRHVIVDDDGDFVGLVGFGNAVRLEEEELNPTRLEGYGDAPYVAPEVRNERSGATLKAGADIYSLGALSSFVLTGREPTHRVESPLEGPAYDKLLELDPPGLTLLVARCLQPRAKDRLESVDDFVTYTSPGRQPEPDDIGVTRGDLPEPWEGARPPRQQRSLESKISTGPLVSVARDETSEDATAEPPAQSGPVAEFQKKNAPVKPDYPEPEEEPDDEERREVSMAEQVESRDEDRVLPEPSDRLPPIEDLPTVWRWTLTWGLPTLGVLIALILMWFGVL
jgi:serine/threonine protein kinase